MNEALKIQFKNCDSTRAIEKSIFDHFDKLDRHFSPIVAGKVTIEKPHRSKHQGGLYRVTINLTTPGKELFVGKATNDELAHCDVYVAIRDAFLSMEKKLKTHFDQLRHEVKTHISPSQGKVIRLFPRDGYGFIETSDGRHIYFNENCVLNENFSKLNLGSKVRFSEELGDKGPQASTIEYVRSKERQNLKEE
jgi:cold shock CspA family protein/ribosome-associated translation inhibitor RaiA